MSMTISTVKYTKLFISVKYNNIIIIKFNLILRKRRYMCTFILPPFRAEIPNFPLRWMFTTENTSANISSL